MNSGTTPGFSIARVASILLLLDALLIIATALHLYVTTGFHLNALQVWMTSSRLPVVLYGIWALGLFGTVGALTAIVLYRYRSTWFWWCLVIAALS